PHHFMALFLDVALNVDLTSARRSILGPLAGREPRPFLPHISLAYGLSEDALIDRESRNLIDKTVGQRIVFNRVAVMKSAKSLPVSDWATLSSNSLRNMC
ncbi:hypothetical protein N9M66_06630, partial [Litoreibacter sp.]|nr:hypothetical protein [Litoreibacter sp.]